MADSLEGFVTWPHHHDVMPPFSETTMAWVWRGTFFTRLELQNSVGYSLVVLKWRCGYGCAAEEIRVSKAMQGREHFGVKFK